MADAMNSASATGDEQELYNQQELYNEGRDNLVNMRASLSVLKDSKSAEAWAQEFSTELVRHYAFDHNDCSCK